MAQATKTKNETMLIPAPACFPLRKGDIAIGRRTAVYLKGDIQTYYVLEYVAQGGKNPREKSGASIDTDSVVAVIRKGWEIPLFAEPADSIEEAVEIAKKYRP